MSFLSIAIPRHYITNEILSWLITNFDNAQEVYDTELDISVFEKNDIPEGELSMFEALLVKRKAPFDRYTSNPEKERKYRPGKFDEPPIDIEINRIGGSIMIDTRLIRNILRQEELTDGEIINEIYKLLNQTEPAVSFLEDWIGIAAPVVSTAEVEMSRFSGIL